MAGDDVDRVGFDVDRLLGRNVEEVLRDHVGGDRAEIEALGSRLDRMKNLVRLGRREDEDDVLRRLLERFQQRVERRGRKHVDLVDHIDLLVAAGRGQRYALKDVACVFDTGVRRGVEFDHIE